MDEKRKSEAESPQPAQAPVARTNADRQPQSSAGPACGFDKRSHLGWIAFHKRFGRKD